MLEGCPFLLMFYPEFVVYYTRALCGQMPRPELRKSLPQLLDTVSFDGQGCCFPYIWGCPIFLSLYPCSADFPPRTGGGGWKLSTLLFQSIAQSMFQDEKVTEMMFRPPRSMSLVQYLILLSFDGGVPLIVESDCQSPPTGHVLLK